MRFDPAIGKLKCDHCENVKEVVANAEANVTSEGYQVFDSTLYSCPQCGAQLISDQDTAATFCNFCGASVLLESRVVKMAAPNYVIPFSKTKEECFELYKKRIKRAIYAPSYMHEPALIEKMRGIYMPYWIYEFAYQGPVYYTGKKEHRSGDYIITDEYALTTDIDAAYKGTGFDASANFADELSDAIAPYNIRGAKYFSTGYLSGFYADTADVPANVYEEHARQVVSLDIGNKLAKNPEFSRYNANLNTGNVHLKLVSGKKEMGYFPVWFMSFKHKDKVCYTAINGQNGKMVTDIPIDPLKYIIGSIILAVPIALLLNFALTLRPDMMAIVAAACAIISYFIANGQMNQIYTRQFYLDDIGLQSVRGGNGLSGNNTYQKKAVKKKAVNLGATISGIGLLMMCLGIEIEVLQMVIVGFFTMFIGLVATSFTKQVVITSGDTSSKYIFKQPFKEKKGVLIKPIIAVILSVLIRIINPYLDEVYYGVELAVMAFIILGFIDIIKLHNKLALRMPRQFAQRGGDEIGM